MFLRGTDDFHVIKHISTSALIGTIYAQGHKVTQQFDDEYASFKQAVKATAEAGLPIVAVVIDTYDADRVIREYAKRLVLLAAQSSVHVVFRPDSGNTWQQAVDLYHELHRGVPALNASVIIGEEMDFENVKKADAFFEEHGVPLNFVSYGVGGGFYNYITRDTLGWAMKTAYSNGKPRMKFSMNPIKRSIPGAIALNLSEDNDMIVSQEANSSTSLYKDIYFYDGTQDAPVTYLADWEDVRLRALSQSTAQSIIYLDGETRGMIENFNHQYRMI
jgi:nicotinamide phosphoribosyltransferase